MVVIDEATQATEPATLIPLTKGCQCAVMAGDPKQLPPVIRSMEARAPDVALDVTLLERLTLPPVGLCPMLLDTQYRMHPGIAAFPRYGITHMRNTRGYASAATSARNNTMLALGRCSVQWFLAISMSRLAFSAGCRHCRYFFVAITKPAVATIHCFQLGFLSICQLQLLYAAVAAVSTSTTASCMTV